MLSWMRHENSGRFVASKPFDVRIRDYVRHEGNVRAAGHDTFVTWP